MLDHVAVAMEAELAAPDKPVLLVHALNAGCHLTLRPAKAAFYSGYDEQTVREALERLLDSGVIYLFDPQGGLDDSSAQLRGGGLRLPRRGLARSRVGLTARRERPLPLIREGPYCCLRSTQRL